MAPRTVYANLVDGYQPANLLDFSFQDVGSLGVIPCSASGTNAITITPIAALFPPTINNPPNQLQCFSFAAVNNSTGLVTAKIDSATGFFNVYRTDGVTQATTGDIKTGITYVVSFNSALNSNAGGLQILSPETAIANQNITGATISNSTITTSTISGNTWTAGTGTLTIAALKTLTANNSLTLAGTDGTTQTFPTTSATIARTDAGQTFTGTNAFGVLTATTVNGNTLTAGTYTLTGAAAKTLTFNNSLTLAGTDATTLTFQGTDTYVGRATTDTLTNKTIDTAGPNTLKVNGVTLSVGQYPGTATNDSATAGNFGEFISSTIASGSAVALTSNTAANVTSISLTAGDWDVSGSVAFSGGVTTTVGHLDGDISLTSATIDLTAERYTAIVYNNATIFNFTPQISNPVGPTRISLASTTSVFLVARALFATSTCSAFGTIRARRIR